ncbi:MAG TPA: ABC transporter permease, partial [Flavitalea sp.]|nr:ABC transporter permease [Flavitalea sp.]
MLKAYIKIAWRNIIKKPFFSAITIVGLFTGLAFTFLVAGYVWSETNVNHDLRHSSRQFIIQSKWTDPNLGYEIATLGPLAKTLREQYPGLVANFYRFDGITTNVSKGDKHFREGLQVGDSTFLEMYGFRILHGNALTALNEPYSLVITADRAIKYFGKTEVLGNVLTIESFSGTKHDFRITAVMEVPTKNSVTSINDQNDNRFFVPTSSLSFFGRNMEWFNSSIAGYIELQPGIKPADLDRPITQIIKLNAPSVQRIMKPYLVALEEYYLVSNNGLVKKTLYAVTSIAFFILLMAVINFVNLSISRSAARLREIGIRKVLGGIRKQLIIQFLSESVLIVIIATLLAVAVYALTKNYFGNITGKEIPGVFDFPAYFGLILFAFAICVGLIAGFYPALVLSSLETVASLKSQLNAVKENVILRKSLVAFQFVIATIVFTGALIITQQTKYFFKKDLGYDKEYMLSAQLPRDWSPQGIQHIKMIRDRLSSIPEVRAATVSFEIPNGMNSGNLLVYRAIDDSTHAISSQLMVTDELYAKAYNIPLAAGVYFDESGIQKDSTVIVINEKEAIALGWKNPLEAVGQQLRIQGGGNPLFTIKGVVKDFHFSSMQNKIQPVTILNLTSGLIYRFMSLKIKPGNISNSLRAIERKWAEVLPGAPFEYNFMEANLEKLYQSELQMKKASMTATGLALVIVLLGVLGLISLSVQKRTKEIAIRKVLGSSLTGILALFMKEFLIIVLIAALVACPIAYMIMHQWLEAYAYRIDLTAWPFILSIGGV